MTTMWNADSRETAQRIVERYTKRRENPRNIWGTPYGRPALDAATGGIQTEPSNDYKFLVSRPSVGKTSWATSIAHNVGVVFHEEYQDTKVVRVVLLEGGRDAFQTRMACMLANVPHRALETGKISDEGFERFKLAQREIFKLPIEYLDTEMEDVSLDKIDRFIRQGDTGWWMLDHIGMVPGARQGANQLSDISNELRKLCKATAPCLILTHQNRTASGPKDDKDQRPTMENIAGADFIGRDADVVFGLYRPDKDKSVKTPAATGQTMLPGELIILKNRNGPEGNIHMWYHSGLTKWEDNDSQNRIWLDMLER